VLRRRASGRELTGVGWPDRTCSVKTWQIPDYVYMIRSVNSAAGRRSRASSHWRPAVVITGGAGGIGRATTQMLLADGFAVAVVDHDRDAVESLREEVSAQHLLTTVGDVRAAGPVEEAVDRVLGSYGRIAGLCTCAAIKRRAPLAETSLPAWQETIDINLTGTFLAIRSVMPRMTEARFGRIVTISSPSGYGEANAVAYAASKGAILALTRSLALEGLPYHVAVNCVVPGVTRTGMADLTESQLSERGRKNVTGHINTPEDVARTIKFLLSDEAATVSGAILEVGRIQGTMMCADDRLHSGN
jgi:NAD(P)-dependent dehydrogenase (short-subunit alcohol dehydrogenase family)